jgi:hypothetical protein
MKRSDRNKRLQDIHRQVGDAMQSAPIEVPDLTSAIMSRVDAERAFLAPSVRKRLNIARWSLGGTAILLALGVALTLRYAPDGASLVDQPAPLSGVVSSFESSSGTPLAAIRQTVETVARTEPAQIVDSLVAAAVPPTANTPEPAGIPLGFAIVQASERGQQPTLASSAANPEFVGPVAPLSRTVSLSAFAQGQAQAQSAVIGEQANATMTWPVQARWNVRNQSSDLRVHLSEIRSRTSIKPVHPVLLESDDVPTVK